ncbi:MAG: 23S rRNA (adenine(2503)-C(2))-methyltransferase RlmN [Bacteroidota bacterium]
MIIFAEDMAKQRDIRELSLEALTAYMIEIGEKKFRAQQVYDWIWKKQVQSFEEMQNIQKGLRKKLAEAFTFKRVTIDASYKSKDGTVKYAFRLASGHEIEGVLIPTPKRLTACISSQAGCSLDCSFCATGLLPLMHNLKHYEIYDQVQILREEAQKHFGRNLTNIVYMGMGEPLLNYRNVMGSIQMITSEAGLHMSPRRITVSTSGISKMIKKLGEDQVPFEFALSLHAADDEKRTQIMSINKTNDLESLREALLHFYDKTKTRVTYEYCLFRDFNDSLADAKALATFARIIPSKINLIEYNPVPESPFLPSTPAKTQAFVDYLESRKLIVNVRRSRGKDVNGACGQLALREKNTIGNIYSSN